MAQNLGSEPMTKESAGPITHLTTQKLAGKSIGMGK